MCSSPGFRAAITRGSAFSAAITGAPAAVAPQGITAASISANGRTVPYRPASSTRQSRSSSSPAGGSGSSSSTVSTAAASCSRETTCSIWSSTSPTVVTFSVTWPGAPRVWWRLDSPQMLWSGWPLSSTVPPPGGTTV
jgi:hypothetical protein